LPCINLFSVLFVRSTRTMSRNFTNARYHHSDCLSRANSEGETLTPSPSDIPASQTPTILLPDVPQTA
jgi:hypothetical protein